MDSPRSMSSTQESPKVWTQLESTSKGSAIADEMVATDDHMIDTNDSMATTASDECEEMCEQPAPQPMGPTGAPLHLHCLSSGDGTDYSVMAVVNGERSERSYCPSQSSRHLHNHKERLRRSRMKCSCDALRALVPGVTDKTDKATVLEHSVAFLLHLSKCDGVKCTDYMPTIPPPMSAKLLDLYPTLMTGEYQYYESAPNLPFHSSQVLEVTEHNGAKYVTTTDGFQYMIIESTDTAGTASPGDDTLQPMDTNEGIESTGTATATDEAMSVELMGEAMDDSKKCVQQVVDLLCDNKENIDPKAVVKQRRRPKATKTTDSALQDNNCGDNAVNKCKARPKGRPRKVKPIDL